MPPTKTPILFADIQAYLDAIADNPNSRLDRQPPSSQASVAGQTPTPPEDPEIKFLNQHVQEASMESFTQNEQDNPNYFSCHDP